MDFYCLPGVEFVHADLTELDVLEHLSPQALRDVLHEANRVLADLGVADKPRLVALNKIDQLVPHGGDGNGALSGEEWSTKIAKDMDLGPGYVPVSAKKSWGL